MDLISSELAPVTTTVAALERAARLWPTAPALVDEQWSTAPTTLTWAELHAQAIDFAAALIAHEVTPGDTVAIWAPNSWHWPIALFGTHYAGARLVPLNTRYTCAESLGILNRVHPKVVVASGEFLGTNNARDLVAQLPDSTKVLVCIDLSENTADNNIAGPAEEISFTKFLAAATDENRLKVQKLSATITSDTVSDVLFTSGTTGSPKGAVATHGQTIAGAKAWGDNGQLRDTDVYLMANPFFHTFGYKAGILVATLYGTTMIPLAVYSPTTALQLIDRHRVTVFPGAPTIFQTLLDAPDRSQYNLTSLRLVVTGAAVVPIVLIERIQAELGADAVITAYGQTETSGFITTCTTDDDAVTVATTCGRPFTGMEIKLSAEGEVLARGQMVMLGYLDDPTATAQTIDADGWLRTGDIGTIDNRGNLTITDRLKDMYICGGFNVYPAEVEQIITRIPGVTECAVIGIPDARLGEVGKAFVVAEPTSTMDEEAVIAYASEFLAKFKVPTTVTFIDALPRNAGGKVLKRNLQP